MTVGITARNVDAINGFPRAGQSLQVTPIAVDRTGTTIVCQPAVVGYRVFGSIWSYLLA